MGALLHHAPALQHHQTVGALQGRQAVRDGNRGAALHQVFQGFLDFFFGFGIDRRSGLVQYQDARIDEQRARNRDALALTARQALTTLAHHGVVAMRQAQDELMRVRGAGSGHDLGAAGVRQTVGNVLGNGAEKQKGLLQHQPDIAAEVGNRIRADVDPIHQNRALGHIIKTANQIHQRAFPRTTVADQPDHLARRDLQVDAPVHRAVAVAKAYVAQLNTPLHPVHLHRVLRLWHARYMVQDVKNALGR